MRGNFTPQSHAARPLTAPPAHRTPARDAGPFPFAPVPMPQSRRSLTCPGTRVVCPACRHPLPRLDVRDGHGFATCSHKARGANCGQHFYWSCTARLCTVIPLSAAEYEALYDGHHTPAEILAALGVETTCGRAA